MSSTKAAAPKPIFFTQSRQPQDAVPDHPIVIAPRSWLCIRSVQCQKDRATIEFSEEMVNG